MMLVYCERAWNVEQFLPYVAYLDAQGNPRDWFYDSFLFMMYGGAPSGQTYYDGATDKSDWEYFVNSLFAPDTAFAGLESALVEVARRLRVPVRTVPVAVMIPYPSPRQQRFGDVDGDGRTEDLSHDADRMKVVRWLLSTFLQRWRTQNYPHLRLWGFYWMNEGADAGDEAIVRQTAEEVHRLGYRFLWIPYFNAPGIERWRDLGFDLAILQPNYAFMKTPGTLRIPDENRLTVTANRCRQLGMGIEIELNEALFVDEAYRINLQMYLEHGDRQLDGYQHDLPRAYYQGYDTIARLCRSKEPRLRALYDDLYRFHKGTYRRKPPYQPLSVPRVRGYGPAQSRVLVDRVWRTRADARHQYLRLKGRRNLIDLDLGAGRLVSDLRVHWVLSRNDGLGTPQAVRLLLSDRASGESFTEVCAEDRFDLQAEHGGGFTVLRFAPRFARRARLIVEAGDGQSVGIDEILLLPTAHLLWGSRVSVSEGAQGDALCLTDGIAGGTSRLLWKRPRASLSAELSGEWVAEALWVHFRRMHPRAFAPAITVKADGDVTRRVQAEVVGSEGWATVRLPDSPIKLLTLTLEDRRAGAVAVDEILLILASNLAMGCPYVLEPPFLPTYPDTGGKELTDGELTTQGFGDGKTVGWTEWNGTSEVSIIFDLGQSEPLSEVAIHLQGGGYAGVHFPDYAGVSLSEDGSRWRLAGSTRQPPAVVQHLDVENAQLGWVRLSLGGAKARFVKLRLVPRGWLMLSEVQIFSGGRNIAQGMAYTVRPSPTSTARYADNSGKLTDGVYSTPGSGWALCAGFDQGEPSVTVDLLAVRRIRLARAHLVGGGPGAVWFPEEMRVLISTDGKEWHPVGVTRERPGESGDKEATGFMAVRFAPREARYVRFQFVRRGWLMVDEVEVW
ncbi:MAG: DUF4855 domain-containing protein [Chthonomonadetes bacterium]|nr:DUF4855 domain-containing protein [Chthonomonadetes bacterium]